MTRMAANSVRAHRAGWIAPYPTNPLLFYNVLDTEVVACTVAYVTCMNIALNNGTQALEKWCEKWL